MPLPPWTLFRWGSRGLWYTTGVAGVFMAHIFIPDGVRVVIQGIGKDAVELIHVLHVKVPSAPPSYADCLTIAQTVNTWVGNYYKHMWTPDTECQQVVATSTAAAPGPQATVSGGQLGDRSGTQVTNDVTLCLKLATHTSGRRHRGRFYAWPAALPDLSDPNFFTVGYTNAMLGVMNALGSLLNTAGYTWGIASYTDAQIYPITSVVAVDRVVDAQRRRLPLRGR
jgi:hypothetical protein